MYQRISVLFVKSNTANLAERVLDWQGVAPTSIPLRNAIKSVACVQTSVPFKNVIKKLCTLKKADESKEES